VIAVRRLSDSRVVTNPPAGYRFEPDDVLVVLGTPEQLEELTALAGDWDGNRASRRSADEPRASAGRNPVSESGTTS
jgi:uncharacterized protein with PhoU and TrkA domain